MKIGDLVKWNGWKYPMVIVGSKRDTIHFREGTRGTYYRCLAGEDYIWLFEDQLEAIK